MKYDWLLKLFGIADLVRHNRVQYNILIVDAGVCGTNTACHLPRIFSNPSDIAVIDRIPFSPDHVLSTTTNKLISSGYSTQSYIDRACKAIDAGDTWPELKGKGSTI